MALTRVLVLYKWRRFAPPDKHTRKSKLNCLNEKILMQKRSRAEAIADRFFFAFNTYFLLSFKR